MYTRGETARRADRSGGVEILERIEAVKRESSATPFLTHEIATPLDCPKQDQLASRVHDSTLDRTVDSTPRS